MTPAASDLEMIPSREELELLAELYHQMAYPTRLAILMHLLSGAACVCELAEAVDVSPSAVSHQMRLLRTAGLVRGNRRGRHVDYSLADDHVRDLLETGLEHVRE